MDTVRVPAEYSSMATIMASMATLAELTSKPQHIFDHLQGAIGGVAGGREGGELGREGGRGDGREGGGRELRDGREGGRDESSKKFKRCENQLTFMMRKNLLIVLIVPPSSLRGQLDETGAYNYS